MVVVRLIDVVVMLWWWLWCGVVVVQELERDGENAIDERAGLSGSHGATGTARVVFCAPTL